jgi:hypothetical protein
VQEFEHRHSNRPSRTVTDSRIVAQVHLILTIIDEIIKDKKGKSVEYTGAFSEAFLFNSNSQINNTTGILSVRRRKHISNSRQRTLQAFKFYELTTIVRPVHLVPKELSGVAGLSSSSYYVNNYIDWDEYNRLYSSTFNRDWTRTVREYQKRQALIG